MQVVLSDSEQEAREDGTEEKVEKRHPKPNHDKGKERTKTTVNGKRKRMPLEEEEADCSEYEPSADEKINDEDDEDYMVKAPRQKGSTRRGTGLSQKMSCLSRPSMTTPQGAQLRGSAWPVRSGVNAPLGTVQQQYRD